MLLNQRKGRRSVSLTNPSPFKSQIRIRPPKSQMSFPPSRRVFDRIRGAPIFLSSKENHISQLRNSITNVVGRAKENKCKGIPYQYEPIKRQMQKWREVHVVETHDSKRHVDVLDRMCISMYSCSDCAALR